MDWSAVLAAFWQWLRLNAAIIVALCSLVFTIWHARRVQRHYRLSVRPHLQFDLVLLTYGNKAAGLYLSNKGLGPARVVEMTVRLDGSEKLHSNSFVALQQASKRSGVEGVFRLHGLDPRDALDPKEELGLVVLREEKDLPNLKPFLDKLRVEIDYESFYEDRHTVAWKGLSTGGTTGKAGNEASE